MSTLLFPHIYFNGEISWDPGLGNNFNIYDPIDVKVNVPAGMTLPELRAALPVQIAQSWNHFGTHDARFENVVVTGVAESPNRISRDDPLVGKPVVLNGKLVDLNSRSDHGTQIYFDEVQVGDLLGGITARRDRRMHARYLNFARNMTTGGPAGASAVWDVRFPNENVTMQNSMSSSAIEKLDEARTDEGIAGIAIRFHTYGTRYFLNGEKNTTPQTPRDRAELIEYYRQGENFSNPAYSFVCGVITLWREDDFVGHPGGRFLPVTGERDRTRLTPGYGVTFIEVDRARELVVLDMGETIMEQDLTTRDKVDFGTLSLGIEDAGTTHEVASIPTNQYNKDAYEASAGIVAVDLSGTTAELWTAIDQGRFTLTSEDGQYVVRESDFVVVVEDRDIYIDEGDQYVLDLPVRYRGKPAPEGTLVQVATYDEGVAVEPLRVDPVDTLTVNAQGHATLTLSADRPSIKVLVFNAYDPGGPEPVPAERFHFGLRATAYHCNVRVLPFDDELAAQISDDQLTYAWVYENILAAYDVINPVMSRPSINASMDDRNRVIALARVIKRLIRKDRVESVRYMPVTRDLSNGKRRLLERWCDLALQGSLPPEPIPAVEIELSTEDRRLDLSN